MKSLLRSFIINLAALSIAVMVIPGFANTGGAKTLIIAILVLAVINLFIRPVISLLLLPINLITLGAFRWLINVIVMALLTALVLDLKISSFVFDGIDYQGFVVPAMQISRFWTLVLVSLSLSASNAFLFWLAKE